jgi:type IV fimbrial biogenesis protein FimT
MGRKVTDFNIPAGLSVTRLMNSGFTMVELMVTIMVAAILMIAAVPSFTNTMVSSRLTTQSNDIVAAINYARSDAIKRNGSVSLCRADSDTATACVGSSGAWTFWIVRTSAGDILRRGTINTYSNKVRVSSTLTNDTVQFGADGLARTGTGLVNNHQINICATNVTKENFRRITLGAGSRVSTTLPTGTCS